MMISHLRWCEYIEERPDLGPNICTTERKLQYRQDFLDPESLNNFPEQPRVIEGKWVDVPIHTLEMQRQEEQELARPESPKPTPTRDK